MSQFHSINAQDNFNTHALIIPFACGRELAIASSSNGRNLRQLFNVGGAVNFRHLWAFYPISICEKAENYHS